MDRTTFFGHIAELAPGRDYDESSLLEAMAPFHRLAIVRWLCDLLERPVDVDIVRQFATLGAAWSWLEGALANGEPLAAPRRVQAGSSTRFRRDQWEQLSASTGW